MIATPASAAELELAFDAFNAHSAALEASYRELEAKVGRLTEELESARSARHRELLAKERLGERLARTLEALPGAVVMLDAAGVIRERNEEAARLLNRPLRGRAWAEIVRREFTAATDADGDLVLNDGRILSLKRRRLAPGEGDILLLTDVTESRRLRELLARHQRLSAIGETTARLAHQIRTPLASALLYASQLATGDASGSRVGRRIVERLRELDRLVRDMLQFAGGARADEGIVVARELLADVAETCRAHCAGDLQVSVDVAGSGVACRGNRDALKGVLCNLVENAAQAAGETGRIELAAYRDGDKLCLTVTDDGPGIPAALRDRVFDAFYTTRPQGTGLGLAVVRSVVEAHGGDVLLDSGPDGTTFALYLPAAEGAAAEPPVGELCHG